MRTRWNIARHSELQERQVSELRERTGVSSMLAKLLVARGVTTATEAERFLRPQLSALHDPFLMRGMDAAVERLNEAIGRRERIMVYGDYDVDGCTAVALVYKFLRQFCGDIEYYVPDRYEEGYGISRKALDYAADSGVRLVITLDCGTKAHDEVAYAKKRGVDFIVCDHHTPDGTLPSAVAVLNPRRADDAYPFKHLCGCGVGFKFMQAFAQDNGIPFSKLVPLLDLCAVSIAADLVEVTGENRILAYYGLRQLNKKPNMGLKAIMNLCYFGDKDISMGDIMFKIGPRINAAGRMGKGERSVDLLVQQNAAAAAEIARELDGYNEQRKEVDRRMTEEANTIVGHLNWQDRPQCLVISGESWSRGVTGIVASRVADMYYLPTVVLAKDGDRAVGSARSVAGFDIHEAVKSCGDMLISFGGHAYACGLTLRWNEVERFRERMENYAADQCTLGLSAEPTLEIAAALDFCDITKRLRDDIKRLSPFGPGNRKPLFVTYGVRDYGASKVVGRGQEHIRLELVDPKSGAVMHGMAFGKAPAARRIKSRQSFDIAYSIEDSLYNRGGVQLQIEDLRFTERPADDD